MNVVKRSEYCGEKKAEVVSGDRKVFSISGGTVFSGNPIDISGTVFTDGVFYKSCEGGAVRLAYDDTSGCDGFLFDDNCIIHNYKELNVTLVIEDC